MRMHLSLTIAAASPTPAAQERLAASRAAGGEPNAPDLAAVVEPDAPAPAASNTPSEEPK